MENMVELVCGCFSSNPDVYRESGRRYCLPEERIYDTYQEMFAKEMALPEEERMDFVVIVTPNKHHFEPAMMRMEQGVKALLSASQIAVGEANGVNIRVYGEKAGMQFIETIVEAGWNEDAKWIRWIG